jgi:hypothetical protein
LIGDFTLVGAGDEDADDLPHSVVALLTEENVVFSGEDSSLAGAISTLGVDISRSGVDLGLSAVGLEGKVGSGRDNRECDAAGDGFGDADFGVSTCFGSGDFCGVL